MNALPSRRRPRLVDPDVAAEVPGLTRVAVIAVVLAVLSAVAIVAQAVALADVVNRSLLHHAPLGTVTPAIAVVGLAILVRAALHVAGDLFALSAADRVVATLRGRLLRHALALGPGWLAGERPGELSLTATRGLGSLHTYSAVPAPGGRGRRHPTPVAGLGGYARTGSPSSSSSPWCSPCRSR